MTTTVNDTTGKEQSLDLSEPDPAVDHIQKAEALLSGTWEPDVYVSRPPRHRPPDLYAIAVAQVHATLAVAAATREATAASTRRGEVVPVLRPAVPA